MHNITLAIGIFGSVLVLLLRPAYALAIYISILLWYPSYLVLSAGTIDMPIGRIVIAVLLVRCLCDSRIRNKFIWSRLDTWVAFSMLVYVVTYCVTRPLSSAIENRGGFLMDTWFAYLAVRFCITNPEEFVSTMKWVAITLAPLAVLGIFEAFNLYAPFDSLGVYSKAGEMLSKRSLRWGLFRAKGPFVQPIMYGTAFTIFLSAVFHLRFQKRPWRVTAFILSGFVVIGTFFSLSSGPWIMLIMVVICLIMEKYKYLIKPLLLFLLFSCISIAIISNRPFYYVLVSYANPLGGSGRHRAKLIDVAIEHFNEWWLIGYGGEDPGWGHYFGMSGTDVTNEYVLAGVRYGILGVIVLCGVLVASFCGLRRAYEKTTDPRLKSLFWALGSTIVAIAVTFMSVSFFGPPKTLFYIVLGVIGSSLLFTTPVCSGGTKCFR